MNNIYLAHHGVKGMHWGVRRSLANAALGGIAIGAGGVAVGAALHAVRKRSQRTSTNKGISSSYSSYYSRNVSGSSLASELGKAALKTAIGIYGTQKASNTTRRGIGSNIYSNSRAYNQRMARRQDAIAAFTRRNNPYSVRRAPSVGGSFQNMSRYRGVSNVPRRPSQSRSPISTSVNELRKSSAELARAANAYSRMVSRTPDTTSYAYELLRKNQSMLRR